LRRPRIADADAFLDAVRRSRTLHRPWVAPPATPAEFRTYVQRGGRANREYFLAWERGGPELVGALNLSEIVRGPLQSCFLGYYVFVPHDRQGLMSEALALVLAQAFGRVRLHRVEANVQPENERSIELLRRAGFRHEGFSPRYLKIAGRWRDHERWAILSEEYRDTRRKR